MCELNDAGVIPQWWHSESETFSNHLNFKGTEWVDLTKHKKGIKDEKWKPKNLTSKKKNHIFMSISTEISGLCSRHPAAYRQQQKVKVIKGVTESKSKI